MAYPSIDRLAAALEKVPAHELAAAEMKIDHLAAQLEASIAPEPPVLAGEPAEVSIRPDDTFLKPVVEDTGAPAEEAELADHFDD